MAKNIASHSLIKVDFFGYLMFLIILFCIFVIFPKNKDSSGFKVYKGESLVLTYIYGGDLTISNQWLDKVEFDKTNTIITINLDKNQFNQLVINESNKTVKMLESTCSDSKDCVHSPAISSGGMIYCAPHDLKILPTQKTNAPPSVG